MDRHDRTATPPPHQQEEIASVAHNAYALDSFGRIIFIVIIVQIVLMIFLNLYEKSRLKSLQTTLANDQTTLNSSDYRTLNSQVNDVLSGSQNLQLVLNSKVHWSKFYTMLDNVTPKDTRFNSVSIGANGSFKCEGETASFTSLAQALVAWKQGATGVVTPFSSVKLTNDGYLTDSNPRRVSFTISGQINTGVLQ